MIRKARTW
jgi:hypothetical protein